jgi:hypothetical protein
MAEISVHKGHLHRVKSKYQLMLMHEKPSVQDIKSITEEKIEEGNVRKVMVRCLIKDSMMSLVKLYMKINISKTIAILGFVYKTMSLLENNLIT